MTPEVKTKFKDTAQTRALAVFSSEPSAKRIDTEFYVEGYAALYEPYLLYYDKTGQPVYECFERGCFDECDMSDVVFQYNHQGKVFARNSNGSLIVEPDEKGLFIAADLSRTSAARNHYEDDIKTGMVTRMSLRFRAGDFYYSPIDRTIYHRKVMKLYDVSSVSIPANADTSINARAWVDGEIAQAARSEAELEERRRRLRAKINISTGGKQNG